MAYCTVDDVRVILRGNAEDPNEGTAASLADETITVHIASASAEIDANLYHRFTLPFNPVPDLVNNICRDIAAYLSDLTFRENVEYKSPQEPILLRYQRAEALLKSVRVGDIYLPDATGLEEPGQQVNITVANPYDSALFSSDDFIFPTRNPTDPGWHWSWWNQ